MYRLRNALRFHVLIAFTALASVTQAQILYDQPSDVPNKGSAASQNDSGGFGNFATTYDNFALGSQATITDVHWTGQYFNGAKSTMTAFTLAFWNDNGGEPGALLAQQSIPGVANETFFSDHFAGPVYTYDVDLLAPFVAAAGATYWLSIVPDMTFPPQWGWYASAVGDGVGFQDFFGTRTNVGFDLAFTLTGRTAEVPEPGTLAMLTGAGVVGLGIIRRRK